MPTYDYACPVCGAQKEVRHSMAECDAPSAATLAEISCCWVTIGDCDGPTHAVRATMRRFLSGAPALGLIAGMSPQQRHQVLKARSRAHFQREIAPKKVEMDRAFVAKARDKFGL